jgi:hypothetical protein
VPADDARLVAGLCADCRFAKVVRSDRGKVFYQCGKFFEDARFPKYPQLPVRTCPAFEIKLP